MRITSRDNPIIKNLLKLHQAKRRRERGEYLVYGQTLCQEALAAGVVASLLYTDEEAWSQSGFPAKLLVAPMVMAVLTDNATVEICAVCRIEQRPFSAGSDVVVLDSVQDPGNLGTILRSARAFGLRNIFLSDNCADPYNIKVLRAAHGAHFALAMQSGDLEQYLAHSPNRLVTTYVDEPDDFRHDPNAVYDIVFGNEGSGIRPSLKTLPRQNCRLDIDFESLNVAIAASIILYTTFRRLR
jgi:RNA methyltransferase, TrmH family